MNISELEIHIRPASEVQQEVAEHTHKHMDPSHIDIVIQMHEQICRQVEDSLASLPSDNIGSFNIEVESPTDGKKYNFIIDPIEFRGKAPHEVSMLVKEQIARQMRDAGLNISGLKITIRSPEELAAARKAAEMQIGATAAPAGAGPSLIEISIQMHEQICKQVEDSLANVPIDNIGSFDIDVQSPTDGRQLKFTINPTGFKGRTQIQIMLSVKRQVARQMREAGLDVSGLSAEYLVIEDIGAADDSSTTTTTTTTAISMTPEQQMHEQIVTQVFETYKGMPRTSVGKFKIEFMNPLTSSMMTFTISPQSFKSQSDREVRESISKQITDQMNIASKEPVKPRIGQLYDTEFDIPEIRLPRDLKLIKAHLVHPDLNEEPITCTCTPQNTLGLQFTPRKPGEHKVHIKKHGKKVKGSPFSVMVEGDSFQGGKKGAVVEEQISAQQQQQVEQMPDGGGGPSAREICVQMHEQVCEQVEGSVASMPGGSISSFNIEVQSPIDGSKLSFVVDGSMFDGRSPAEVSTLIKKQIGRQMRDAGMDVSGLTISLEVEDVERQIIQQQQQRRGSASVTSSGGPSTADMAVEMHRQIVEQLESTVSNLPAESTGVINIEVDNPVDGSKIKFCIDQSFFGGKPQSECATLIRSEIARQMGDAGMDVTALHMHIISSSSSDSTCAFNIDPATLRGKSASQMNLAVQQQLMSHINETPGGNLAGVSIEVLPVDGSGAGQSSMKFQIDQTSFGDKTNEELAVLMQEQIQKQIQEAGMDLSACNIKLLSGAGESAEGAVTAETTRYQYKMGSPTQLSIGAGSGNNVTIPMEEGKTETTTHTPQPSTTTASTRRVIGKQAAGSNQPTITAKKGKFSFNLAKKK